MRGLSDLPVHLMALILEKLGTEDNYSKAAHMRLVSKAWRTAFAECPGHTVSRAGQEVDMARICALTPSMSQLLIEATGQPISFTALAGCAQLETVIVSGGATEAIDLRGLPGNVKELAFLYDVNLLPASFSSLTSLSIQTLKLNCISNTLLELHGLLDCLPTLQELSIEGAYFRLHSLEDITIDRLTALTKISLQDSGFVPPLQHLAQLQSVHLFEINFQQSWLGPAFAPLPGLTYLELYECMPFDMDTYDDLVPISSLRTLQMSLSFKHCINLAPDSLASLIIDWDITMPIYAPQPPPIARLTGLTRLKLTWCSNITSPELLRDLPLRELSLLHCRLSINEQLLSLFVPGALPLLQKLHIEDDRSAEAGFSKDSIEFCSDRVLAEILEEEREEAGSQARRLKAAPYFQSMLTLADGILSLPSLQQVSGRSALFDFGMEDELKDWHLHHGVDYALMGPFAECLPQAPLKIWSQAY